MKDTTNADLTQNSDCNLFFVLCTSGGMIYHSRISLLNSAMAEAVQIAEETAKRRGVNLAMRVVEFNSVARWAFGSTASGERHIDWQPLIAGGSKDTAEALRMVSDCMRRKYLSERSLRPIVILITTGTSNYPDKMKRESEILRYSLNDDDRIIRVALGDEAARSELKAFASTGTIQHLPGYDPDYWDVSVPLLFDALEGNNETNECFEGFLKQIVIWGINTAVDSGLLSDGKPCDLNDYPLPTWWRAEEEGELPDILLELLEKESSTSYRGNWDDEDWI